MSEERQANITIEAAPDGIHIKVEYTGALSSIPAALDRLKQAGILDFVEKSSKTAAAPARKGAQRVEPVYQPDGSACCPVHKKPLSEGRYGLYCPSRATGEHANEKGYCNLRFAE